MAMPITTSPRRYLAPEVPDDATLSATIRKLAVADHEAPLLRQIHDRQDAGPARAIDQPHCELARRQPGKRQALPSLERLVLVVERLIDSPVLCAFRSHIH